MSLRPGKLKTHVYRLVDPRNGETFYIGKGRGDRVFAHVRVDGTLRWRRVGLMPGDAQAGGQ